MSSSGIASRIGSRLPILFLALLGTWLGFLWLGDRDLNLADEGFLWYGVKRVVAGEFPHRDFQSYEPGRYFWCAFLAPVFGTGILGVRASGTVFLSLGLFLGLLALGSSGKRTFAWQLLAFPILWLWVFPRHKLYEPALGLALVFGLERWLAHPTRARRVAYGVLVGIGAWFGRNHALYGTLAALFALLVLAWKARERSVLRSLGELALGGWIGSAPLWLSFFLAPGFFASFLETTLEVTRKGANAPQPWPWPWSLSSDSIQGAAGVHELTQVLAFALPLLALVWGALALLRLRPEDLSPRALLVASLCVGLSYLHHASVRSDMAHLAQCIHPMLLLLLACPARTSGRAIVGTLLLGTSLLIALEHHPQLSAFSPWKRRAESVLHEVAGERLRLSPGQADYLERLERTLALHVAPEEEVFFAPSRPTFYPLFGKRSPVRQIYLFWFASEGEEREIETRLEERRVPWALLVDTAMDDREELRFANTHPRVMEYLSRRYEPIPTPLLPADHILLHRRNP